MQPYASKTVLVSTRERPTALSHLEASWFPQEEDNDTALMKAAGNGHLEVVEFLLESGADLSLKNQQGQSAIMFAAAGGHLEIVKLIVRCECDNRLFVSGPSPLGGYDPLIHGPLTAVNWAAYNGHLDVIEFLFFDDDAFELDNSGWAHWNTQPEWGFYWGIIGGHMDVVEYFMEVMPRRISVSWGLMIASYLGDIEMVDRLLQEENINIHWRTSRWIDINTPEGTLYFEEIGFGPLHAAIQQGHEEVLRKLLMHWMITIGADGADRHGETALMFAAAGGDAEMAKRLIDNGAPVNARSDIGETALMFAARWGRTDIVSMLIAEGANASFVNAYNETALSLAEENGHEDVVALLQ